MIIQISNLSSLRQKSNLVKKLDFYPSVCKMCFLNKYAVQHVACIHKKFPTGIAQDSALDKEMVAGLEW